MSFSVNGSNSNSSYAYLQSLLQQGSSQSGTTTQSDPLSALLAALDQQGAGTAPSATGAASSDAGSKTSSSAAATNSSGGSMPQFGPQTLQALLALQTSGNGSSSDTGATTQTTANANGSSTTTITYADGSTATTTTPAASATSSLSDGSNSLAGGANVASGNLIEQLMQMQSQLNPTTAQSLATV